MTTYCPSTDRVGLPPEAESPACRLARRASLAKRTISRRRRIDPTTCERDYTPAQLEFMGAIQRYKETSGRLFPTWSEVLEVVESLGWSRGAADGC